MATTTSSTSMSPLGNIQQTSGFSSMTPSTEGDAIFTDMTTLFAARTEDGGNQTDAGIDNSGPHPFYALADNLFIYLMGLIYLIGVFNNVVIFIIMRRESIKHMSVSVYLSVLSVSDCAVLLCDLVSNWINRAFGPFLEGTLTGVCRLIKMTRTSTFTYSAWLIVCIVMERIVVVYFPFRAKILCNIRVARITCAAFFVFSLALNSFHLFVWEVVDGACVYYPEHTYFIKHVHMWLLSTFYSYFPFLILVFGNIALVYRLSRAQEKRKAMTQGTDRSSDNKTEQLADTAIAICIAYLVFTTPAAIFYTLVFDIGKYNVSEPNLVLAIVIVKMLANVNYTVNLYLYILTSPLFRKEFKALFTCGKPKTAETPRPPV